MLRMVARLNLRARTMPRRSPFINVMPAFSIATSVPVPMAIPTSAAASAGASLIPSPAIATMWPCSRSRLTILLFWCGRTSASTFSIPSCFAMDFAVASKSPVSITICTPCSRSAFNASGVDSLTKSVSAIIPARRSFTATKTKLTDAVRSMPKSTAGSFSPVAPVTPRDCRNRRVPTRTRSSSTRPSAPPPEGRVLEDRVLVGTLRFLQSRGVTGATGEKLPAVDFGIDRTASVSFVFVAVNERLAGMIALTDFVKESTPEALKALREQGVQIVMLTGDLEATAKSIAKQLGIEKVEAEVLPHQKSKIVKRLREQGHIVAMAGDGINDAPALAAADVGIAMGTGTDVAIENAGITLIKGDLRGIVRARKLSRATIRNIKENLAFAFLYNVIGIPIAAGVFFPFFGWLLSPMIASAAMSFSSVSVIANALRLRKASL